MYLGTVGGAGGRLEEVERVLGFLGKLEKLETGECPLTGIIQQDPLLGELSCCICLVINILRKLGSPASPCTECQLQFPWPLTDISKLVTRYV